MNKFYIIPNKKEIDYFKEDLILPLEGYSIGFDVYFSIDEINKIAKSRNISVIINIFLHKNKLEDFKNIINKLENIEYYFIEDFGLSNLLPKDKVVIMGSHLINNYDSINYFNNLGIKNIVVNNELTKEELVQIKDNTNSNLFYFLINRNMLMYSKRPLISSYYEYKNINGNLKLNIKEKSTKKELIIKEENRCTCIFDNNIFSANVYLDLLDKYNFIINLNNMSDEEVDIIMKHYKDKDLNKYIKTDNYFLDNKIIYKLGDKE